MRSVKVKNHHVILLAVAFFIPLAIISNNFYTSLQALSNWQQTDWSGGQSDNVLTTNGNTFKTISSLRSNVAGELTIGARAGWLNESWLYRKSITIANSGSVLTDYQVMIPVNTQNLVSSSKLQSDCDDVRFTNLNGVELSYWLDPDSSCNAVQTNFWVKIDSIQNGNNTIYIYYGNPVASSASNGDNTFEFYDDFNGAALDSNKWQVNAIGSITYTVSGGKLNITDTLHNWIGQHTTTGSQTHMKYGATDNVAVEWKQTLGMNHVNNMFQLGIGFVSAAGALGSAVLHSDGLGLYYNPYREFRVGASIASSNGNNPETVRFRMERLGTNFNEYVNDVLSISGTSANSISKVGLIAAAYPGYPFASTANFDWIFTRKFSSVVPTVGTFGSEETGMESTGYMESNILDAGLPSDWGILNYTVQSGTATVKVRTGDNSSLSGWPSFSSCDPVSSGADISSNNCVHDGHQYIQYQVTLSQSGTSPIFQDIDISYSPSDSIAPTQNATNARVQNKNSGDWINNEPVLEWDAGADDLEGIGLLGYCISLDESNIGSSQSLNPELSAGILQGFDDGLSQNFCPYIVSGTSLNLSLIQSLSLVTNKQYNFSIKAVDLSGNIWNGISSEYQDLFVFKYDGTAPTNPAFISMPSNFIQSKDITIIWPTEDGTAANDVGSGLAGLQYKIGNGNWYGDLHNGNQDLTDLLVNDGTYTTSAIYDYDNLIDGTNIVYFRALDNAGNISTSNVTGVLKINTTAPGQVQNLNVSPSDNVLNSYSFSWNVPDSFIGEVSNLTYCYTVNTLPNTNNCTYTAPGVTTIPADAYATQPGTNNFYVVAKDEAGNINYDTYSTVQFTYSGEAPGIPLNLDVSDISTKETSDWKLAVTWAAPMNSGAGVSRYLVFRSDVEGAACNSTPSAFTQISSVLGTSYIDTGLDQKDYYYCVKACDSANNCSAVSSTKSKLPTGKYTSPAVLLSGPVVNAITTRKAVISWTTDRRSDSKIQMGLSSNNYFEAESAVSAQVTAHTISLDNLIAGTTYYYRAKWTDEDGNTGISEEKAFTTSPAPSIVSAKAIRVGIDSAIIQFTAINAYKANTYFGVTTSFGGLKSLDTSLIESSYIVILDGLQDNTKYYYKINPLDTESFEYEGTILDFTTLPRPTVSNIQIEEVKNVAQPTVNVSWSSNTDISSMVTFYPEANLEETRDLVSLDLVKEHSLELVGLKAETRYVLVVKGIDSLGNQATSSPQLFTTATDTRPPKIFNLKFEAVNPDSSENTSQIIVSWETDEFATSQVQYGEGTNGGFPQSTQKDRTMSYKHVVIISNLKPSSVYHLNAISEDSSGNNTETGTVVTITPKQQEKVFDIVLKGLGDVFNFL